MSYTALEKLMNSEDLTIEQAWDLLVKVRRGAIQDEDVVKKLLANIGSYVASHRPSDDDKPIVSEEFLMKRIEFQTQARYLISRFRQIDLERAEIQLANQAFANWEIYSEAVLASVQNRNEKAKLKADVVMENVSDYREKPIKAKAMELCDDPFFVDALDMIRKKWRIDVYFPLDLDWIALMTPDLLLEERALDGFVTLIAWRMLRSDVQRVFFTGEFDLDDTVHYGLVVAALCFGFTYDDIDQNWKMIWMIARHESVSSADVVSKVDDSEKIMGLFLTIAHLANNPFALVNNRELIPDDVVTNIDNLPLPIRKWVSRALMMSLELGVDPARAGDVIEILNGQPDDIVNHPVELFIKINQHTSHNGLKSFWDIVESEKLLIWGESPLTSKKRPSRTRTRDRRIVKLYDELSGDLRAVVQAYDKLYPDTPINTYDNIRGREHMINPAALDIVRKAVTRMRKRNLRS